MGPERDSILVWVWDGIADRGGDMAVCRAAAAAAAAVVVVVVVLPVAVVVAA